MKLSVIPCAVSLTLTLGCSATSGGSKNDDGNGQGASSSTGATSSIGAQPNLGTGGSLGNLGGSMNPNEPDVVNGECAQQNFVLNSKPADVMLVLDRSKSMIEHTVPPSGLTRWEAVKPAVTAVIAATDASVNWGLKMFPEGEGSECIPESVTDNFPAEIMPGNAATVNGIINSTEALGNGTPTGEAIKKAAEYLTNRGASNQYIVLATDGDPSCPSDSAGEQYAYDQISAAYAAGFPVYVIGVLDPVEDKSKFTVLNQMAALGGTARSDNPVADKFYHAYSQEELTAALAAVTGQVVSCVFEFDKKPPDATNIAVKVNGQKIEQDPTKGEGWEYTSDQFMGLELFGSACQQVKDATENKVDIIFGCKGVPIK